MMFNSVDKDNWKANMYTKVSSGYNEMVYILQYKVGGGSSKVCMEQLK